MYLKTGEEYIQDMIDMNFELYIDGGKISGKSVVNHSQVRPMINAIAATYDMQHEEKLKKFLLCKSHLTGETISRWSHVPQTVDDLIRKIDITRYANRRIGMCSFRCIQNAFPPSSQQQRKSTKQRVQTTTKTQLNTSSTIRKTT